MIAWLLIIQVFAGGSNQVTQAGPFRTEAACEAAAKLVKKELVGTRYVCVPTDAEGAN